MRFRLLFSTLLLLIAPTNFIWAVEDTNTQVKEHIQKGKDFYHHQDYQNAIKEYFLALKLDPNNYEAYGLLGYSQLKAGQIQQASNSLTMSTRLNPNYILGHYNLALAYWADARGILAVDEVQKVIDLYPDYKKTMEKDPQFKPIIKFIGEEKWGRKHFYDLEDKKWFDETEPGWEFLYYGFFNPVEEYPILKCQLGFDDNQMKEINKMGEMIREYLQSRWGFEQGVTNGSAESKGTDYYKSPSYSDILMEKCIEESDAMRAVLKGKEDNFKQWIAEENFIIHEVNQLKMNQRHTITEEEMRKPYTGASIEELANDIENDYLKSEIYKNFLKEKKQSQKNDYEMFIKTWQTYFKKRILTKVYYSALGWTKDMKQRAEFKEKRIQLWSSMTCN
jgi:tetratricopeptide (TPR) repeat protein